MSHGPTYYESKGECIYCGSTNELSNEHIVPYALEGVHVLKDSSCKSCADLTKKFELDVARKLWGDPRISYGVRSRRKKKRPKYIFISDPRDLSKKLKVPYKDYPAAFVYYEMGRAGILDNAHPLDKLDREWVLKAEMCDAERKEAFLKKYGPKSLTMSFSHQPVSFGRLIAKIAYCQVMTQLNREDFDHIALPYILGESENISYVVGGTECLEPQKVGYETSTCALINGDYLVLVGEVRLLASLNSPKYYAVIGVAEGKERVELISKKLGRNHPSKENLITLIGNYKQIEDIPWIPKTLPVSLP